MLAAALPSHATLGGGAAASIFSDRAVDTARTHVNVLLLHNRYRGPGGEERSVAEIATLLRDQGNGVEVLERSSDDLGGIRGHVRAGAGMLAGGLSPDDVEEAVRRTGADLVHAHNIHPLW